MRADDLHEILTHDGSIDGFSSYWDSTHYSENDFFKTLKKGLLLAFTSMSLRLPILLALQKRNTNYAVFIGFSLNFPQNIAHLFTVFN